jgi:hypothetical protein
MYAPLTAPTRSCQAGCALSEDLIPLLVSHLSSPQRDTRGAAAAALADALRQQPQQTSATLAAVVALYGAEADEDADEDSAHAVRAALLLDEGERAARAAAADQLAATRAGVAAGLEALAGVLGPADVQDALHFLVNRGLAEPVDATREAMVAAGARV